MAMTSANRIRMPAMDEGWVIRYFESLSNACQFRKFAAAGPFYRAFGPKEYRFP